MYLTKVNFWKVIFNQYCYKLKSYAGSYTSLVMVQLIAILLSVGGMSHMGGGSSERFDIEVSIYSHALVLIFTMFWAFATAILITTKAYRYEDFNFVTNRITSNMSNILFLLTIGIIGAFTASMSFYLNKIIALLVYDYDYIIYTTNSLAETITGFSSTVLYIFLCGALGYLLGVLVQINRLFGFVIPALFIGELFIGASWYDYSAIVNWISGIYTTEASFFLFVFKVLASLIILFLASITLSNRLEVRR
ncbi:hypothetical protein [Aquibacillus kalidii]|uniref:hypothetical protein n=1 Tax=Aquibacillus kalidii TaxID=2762597 RepID=UPI001C98F86F|nr:hypothetical protein [Aquibacillus kalidii]